MKRKYRVPRRVSAALLLAWMLVGCAKVNIPETDSSPPEIALRLVNPGVDLKEA